MFAGKRPQNIGAKDGQLASCPAKPNCVSSQAESARQRLAPLRFSGDSGAAMRRLRDVVDNISGTTVIDENDHYLYFECATSLLGFVDDLEFLCDADEQVIHVRSASRLGYSDLGVNRKRVESIRKKFELA
jgi:uncharacterized protein (DUF1499 family)